jgi:septal ring factor EnvC (AmiA/AmiB activator)
MGLKLSAIMFVLMCAMGGGGYLYFQATQATIRDLSANNAILENEVNTQKQTIGTLQADYRRYNDLNQELQRQLQASNAAKDELEDKLSEHDLTMLSLRKPGLIERTVNRGTQKAFDDFTVLTTPTNPDTTD